MEDNSADVSARSDARHPLTKWVDEMQDVIRMVTALMEENERQRVVGESAQREQTELREEVARLRAEAQQQRAVVESGRAELEQLRTEGAALQAENDRLRTEQVEAGETASKLLGEMKDLVNQVAHKFQGPSKPSPFSRDPRSPQP